MSAIIIFFFLIFEFSSILASLFFKSLTSFSNIPEGLDKLHFDNEKITYHQMHSLWTAMGAKYQPSVIYKMRLVTFQGNEAAAFTPAISTISTSAEA